MYTDESQVCIYTLYTGYMVITSDLDTARNV